MSAYTKTISSASSRSTSIQAPLLRGTLAVLLTGVAQPALAQTSVQPSPGVEDVEEIVVTAQKRDERLIDVPITVSVASGERMRELGVSDLDELSAYVPGLNIQEQSANNPGVVIRGITSDSGSAQQAARVTLYYNGVDISRSRGSYQDIYDVERIEVIKGPQATLFGTASAIGAISIISAKPQPGFAGAMTAGVGNFDQRLLSGFVNGGSGTLAGRLAFAFKKRDGYVNNIAPGQDDLNGQDQFGARGSLRYRPTEHFKADLILTYDRQRSPGTAFTSGSLPTESGPADPFGDSHLGGSPFSKEVLGAAKLGLTRDVYDANLTLDWDLGGGLALTVIGGYRQFDSLEVFDADGSRAFFLEFAENAQGHQGSFEARFNYTSDRFRGAFGFNAFREDSFQAVPFSSEEGTFIQCVVNVLRLPAAERCIAANGTVNGSRATAVLSRGAATAIPYSSEFRNIGENDSYSTFVDGTFIPTPVLELTAGARLLIEKRRSGFRARVPRAVLTGRSLIPTQVDTGGQTFFTDDSFVAVLPRFNALYRFSDRFNGFVTVSKGRRSPTVQLAARATPTGPVPAFTDIAAENVMNYEVGLKAATRILSGSLGVYLQKYDNFQVSVTSAGGVTQTVSAGSASNLGVEAEVFVKPTSWLSAFANIGYIKGGIDDKPENGRFAGNKFRLQPEVQAAGGFTINAPLASGVRAFATPSVTYRSRIFFEVPNRPEISQGAYTLFNLRGGVSFADERYEIAGFARNLTNKDYLLDAGNTGGAFGIPTFIAAEPRLYGIQASARF